MFCKQCGKELREGAKFCPGCGTAVAPAAAPIQPEAPAAAPVQPEVPAATPVQPEAPAAAPVQPEAPAAASVQPEVPAATSAPAKKKSKVGLIVGLSVGAVVIIAAVVGVLFFMSPAQKANRALKKADKLMGEEAYTEAMVLYEEAYSLDDTKEIKKEVVKAYVEYGEAMLKDKSYETAVAQFEKALEYDDDNDDAVKGLKEARLGWANKLVEASDFEKAKGLYEKILDSDYGNWDATTGMFQAYMGLAEQKSASGDYEQAMELYDEAIDLGVDSYAAEEAKAGCYVGYGDKLLADGDYYGAMDYYYMAMSWDYEDPAAYCGVAKASAMNNDIQNALYWLEEGFRYRPDDADLLATQEYIKEHAVLVSKVTYSPYGYTKDWYSDGVRTSTESFNRYGELNATSTYDENENLVYRAYYSGGSLSSETVYTYDAKGNRVSESYSDFNNSKYSYLTEYTFNENNDVVKFVSTDELGRETMVGINEYDENGNQIMNSTYYYYYNEYDETQEPDIEWYANNFAYDEYNNITGQTSTSGYNNNTYEPSNMYYEYEYDSKGQITFMKMYSGDGWTHEEYNYSYDDKGNVVEEKIVYYDKLNGDPVDILLYYYEYNEDGTVIYEKYEDYSGSELVSWSERTYDDEGKILSFYERHIYADYWVSTTYSYDEKGNVIEEYYDGSHDNSTRTYEYTYNIFGDVVNYYDSYNGETFSYSMEYMFVE